MKFRIKVCNENKPEGWWENYDKDVPSAQEWAEGIVAWYNETLRVGQKPRTLLAVEVLDETSEKE